MWVSLITKVTSQRLVSDVSCQKLFKSSSKEETKNETQYINKTDSILICTTYPIPSHPIPSHLIPSHPLPEWAVSRWGSGTEVCKVNQNRRIWQTANIEKMADRWNSTCTPTLTHQTKNNGTQKTITCISSNLRLENDVVSLFLPWVEWEEFQTVVSLLSSWSSKHGQ